MNRRQFLKVTGAGALAVLSSSCRRDQSPGAMATTRPLGANSDIRVAVIGFNSHGKSHIRAYKSMPGVRLVALCDVDEQVLQTQAAELEKENIRVKTYRDLRALFDSKEIDAVSIATPNHWHALATIWACQAGKDVYVEKPASHNIWEGRKMVEAARKYHRMVQADLDFRSRPALDEAFAFVRSGQIGRIVFVRAWDYKRRESMGKVIGPQKIPANIDYNLWTGPAPMLPLMREKLHYDWHWQWATGNGEIANNGSHQLDQVRWALGQDHLPKSVLSFGGRYGYIDDGQTPNTHVAVYDCDGIPVIYEARGLPEGSGSQKMDDFVGETAGGKPLRIPHGESSNQGNILFCEGGYCRDGVIYDNDGKEIRQFKSPAANGPQANFIKALRSRKLSDLKTDILQGHRSTSICHMGNIPLLCGEPMTFEKARQTISGNPQATKALTRMVQHLTANGIDATKAPITVGAALTMDSKTERFTGAGSEQANLFLKNAFRPPFVIPREV